MAGGETGRDLRVLSGNFYQGSQIKSRACHIQKSSNDRLRRYSKLEAAAPPAIPPDPAGSIPPPNLHTRSLDQSIGFM